jgi:putative ABC transport system permease protein
MSIYLKTAVRSLIKRKGFSLLNILGLSIGMTACLLIFHYVSFERDFDRFSSAAERIYRLRLDSYAENSLRWSSATSYPAFGPTMKKEFPEVEAFCRLYDFEVVLAETTTNNKYKEEKGYFADPSAIPMLGIEMLEGDPHTALAEIKSIILSASTAKKYFGLSPAVGKRLRVIHSDSPPDNDLLVTGVFKDYAPQSHLDIKYLVSYKTLQHQLNLDGDTSNATETEFGWYDFYTYLQLAPRTDVKKFEAKLPTYMEKYVNGDEWRQKNKIRDSLAMIPLTSIHLYSDANQEAEVNGDGQAVSFLFVIALFILGIAWVNYINLSTARSIERAREVGVRKVMGAHRNSLIFQFLSESFLLNTVAGFISLAVFTGLIFSFDRFIGREATAFYLMNTRYAFYFASIFLVGTFLSGLYPAFVLSGFRPVQVLKGIFKNSNQGVLLRQSLMVAQFVISMVLIAGTMVVYQQLKYMKGYAIGANINQTIVLEGARSVVDSFYQNTYQPFKSDLLENAQIEAVTASSSIPGKEIYWTSGIQRTGQLNATAHTMYHMGVDYDFIPAFGIQLLAGRNFSKDFGTDRRSVLLTERGMRELGFQNPEEAIQHKVIRGRDTLQIIGIVSNFHHQGLRKALDPMIFLLRPDTRNFYSIKLKGGSAQNTLAQIEKKWNQYFPSDPFNYFFLDEAYNLQYKSEILFSKVFAVFSLLGILIACFGLLGLSAYNVLQRTKEMGIRKVIGASESTLMLLLSKDFIKLVSIALVIAIPSGYLVMNAWLRGFAYRTQIGWWVFVWTACIALAITFLTIWTQAIGAIRARPARALRSE